MLYLSKILLRLNELNNSNLVLVYIHMSSSSSAGALLHGHGQYSL